MVGAHDVNNTPQQRIDELLDIGNLSEAHDVLEDCDLLDHVSMAVQASDSRLIYYMAGYVARRSISSTKCMDCCQQLLKEKDGSPPATASITKAVDRGGLLYPSEQLNALVTTLENTFARCFSLKRVNSDSLRVGIVPSARKAYSCWVCRAQHNSHQQDHQVLRLNETSFPSEAPELFTK